MKTDRAAESVRRSGTDIILSRRTSLIFPETFQKMPIPMLIKVWRVKPESCLDSRANVVTRAEDV